MRLPFLFLVLSTITCAAQDAPPLPGTAPLTEGGDFSARMVEGIGRWLERETTRAAEQRGRAWREAAAGDGWKAFADAQREKLRRAIGAVDTRTPGEIEEISELNVAPRAATVSMPSFHRVRWPVFDGVNGEGLLLQPAGEPHGTVIVIPDADEPPESSPLAQRFAAQGCTVLVPALVDRRDNWSGSEAFQRFTNQPHREWIYRQAFEFGRTPIGYEVQKIMAAVDALTAPNSRIHSRRTQIAIAGYGEGGLLALHCAALD